MRLSAKTSSLLRSGGLTAGLFGLYLALLPDHLTWANFGGDGGDFLAAILSNGIAHPSGYPLYLLVARGLQWLPLGTPFWRGALLSAITMALAGGLLCLWTERFIFSTQRGRWVVGVLAGLAWGTAPLIWSQAVIVEVHGLQAMLAMAWLWWIGLLLTGKRDWVVWSLALVGGVSLGNHLTILLFLPALIFAWHKSYQLNPDPKFVVSQLTLFCMGALIYLVLPLRAMHYPPINWGNPQTWEGFWWTVSGEPYHGLLFTSAEGGYFSRVTAAARSIIDQFGIPGLILGVIGVTQPARIHKPSSWLLVWTFFAFSAFAVGYNTHDSLVYLIPAYLVAAVWLGAGGGLLVGWRWRSIPVGVVLMVAMLAFILFRIPISGAEVDPRTQTGAEAYYDRYLSEAPYGAILLTQSDADSFPLWYAHFGLGRRQDVVVVVLPLTQYPWYRETLVHVYPGVKWPEMRGIFGSDWGEAVPGLNPERPLCRSQVNQSDEPQVTYACK